MRRTPLSLARSGRPHMMRPVPVPQRPQRERPIPGPPQAGNRAMGRLLGPGGLRVGGISDRFEAEAKGLAGRAPVPGRVPHAPGLSGVGGDGAGRVKDDIAARILGAGGGQPLPAAVRRPLEAEHRAGLGGVRMHTGPEAEALTRAVGARAMTLDHHIFYGRGASPRDLSLTSEEVVHTMQQGAVPTGRPVGRAPKGVIQRDVPMEGKTYSKKKFYKAYGKKYDDVGMGQFKIMTPDSKKTLGTYGMAPCAGLVVAANTPKGWCAGLHHLPGGTGDLVKAYETLKGMVDEAAKSYGGVTESVRYLIPGSSTKESIVTPFEEQIGTFDNDWRALAASYGTGTTSIAVTFERFWKWHAPDGLKVRFMQVQ